MLPKVWWQAFVLRHVEGLPLPEVARGSGLPEEEVRQVLAFTQELLRQKLRDTGWGFLQEEAQATEDFFATAANIELPQNLKPQLAHAETLRNQRKE